MQRQVQHRAPWQRLMGWIVAFFWLCFTGLVGCTAPQANGDPNPAETVGPVQSTAAAEPEASPVPSGSGEASTVLYFLSPDESSLVRQFVHVEKLPENTWAESVVISQIQTEPQEGLLPIVSSLVVLLSLEWSNEVAVVNLSQMFSSDFDMYAVRVAIAQALTELPGIRYVQVLCNGREPGVGGILPVGLLTSEDNLFLQELWDGKQNDLRRMQEAEQGETTGLTVLNRDAAVYYPSSRGAYLMAYPTSIKYNNGWITPLVEALKREQVDGNRVQAVLPGDLRFDQPPEIQQIDGKRIIDLRLSGSIRLFWHRQNIPESVAIGAIVLTLCTFVPDIYGVRIMLDGFGVRDIDGVQVEDGILTRSAFEQTIGQSIRLYYQQKDSTAQSMVTRTVYQRDASTLEVWIRELFKGPSISDMDTLKSPFPGNVVPEDLLSVTQRGELGIINVSQGFANKCAGLSPEEEASVVYAMVNTLTEYGGIRRVQILVDGEVRPTLAGAIYIEEPLIRHVGLLTDPESSE